MGIPFAQGLQFVFDAHQKFVRAGLPCYLRVANFTEDDEGQAAEIGQPFSPSGTYDAGFTDILVDPPPYVNDISMHNIGIFGGRLDFGDRLFIISNSFVQAQLQLEAFTDNNITDPYAVFRARDGHQVIGLFYNSRLFSIDSITHKEAAAGTISWRIIGKGHEVPVTVSGGP